jgi:transitional endoplasmic reticulum ATPase
MYLTVKPLKDREPGSGMAVIDRDVLGDLGVSSGDFVALEGRDGGRAVARVWPSDANDAGREIVRIDGQLRQAANVAVDDRVTIEPIDVEPAGRITIALPRNVELQGDLGPHIRDKLADQAVSAGQTVALPVGFSRLLGRSNRRIPLRVVDTQPGGTVVVTGSTEIRMVEAGAEEVAGEDDDTDEFLAGDIVDTEAQR